MEKDKGPGAGLGVVHRLIGIVEQGFEIVSIAADESHADAGAHRYRGALRQLDRSRDRPVEVADDDVEITGRAQAAQQHREFVASEPRRQVAVPDIAAQALRDRHEYRVPRLVTETVVDLLEAIEVDDQHTVHALVAELMGEYMLEPLLE